MPDGGLFRAARFRDVHLYADYTRLLLHGHVPYRDFFMEYPPGALAVFVPGAAAGLGHYNAVFKAEMALCGALSLVAVATVLLRLGATARRVWTAVLLVALSPVALGPISLNTYDAWPALLSVLALACLLGGSFVLALALLGLAFAAKVYPAVLVPPALLWAWRQRGAETTWRAAGAFAAVALAVAVPFLALAPHGLLESFRAQAARGLQIESLGAQLLVGAGRLGLGAVQIVHHTRGAVSYDLTGTLAQTIAVLSSLLQVVAAALVTWLYARRRAARACLPVAFAAAVAGFLAFTRFFSPQYLVWLIPLVPLVDLPGAWIVLGVALALDQVWFFHYRAIVALGSRSWFVLARDLLVVALLALLLLRLRAAETSVEDEDAVALHDELPLGVRS